MLPQLSHAERMQRAQDKRATLLAFLASCEVYTTAAIASRILDLSERRAVTCLQGLERDRAIKSEMHHVNGRQLKIYGITPHGLAMADQFDAPFFELGRTSASRIMHHIETQRMRLAAEAAGWRDWRPDRARRGAGRKIPDAVAVSPFGERVAIEIERHAKTPKNYAEIIVAYLKEIRAGRYSRVDFVSPDGVSRLIKNAFGKIQTVNHNGEMVKLEEKHLSRFQFHDFNQWPPATERKTA